MIILGINVDLNYFMRLITRRSEVTVFCGNLQEVNFPLSV
jgi:hypothetical protein